MPDIERLTITLPTDMAAVIKSAVANGEYASTSEVIREAVRDWKMKRAIRVQDSPPSRPISTKVWPMLQPVASRILTPTPSLRAGGNY